MPRCLPGLVALALLVGCSSSDAPPESEVASAPGPVDAGTQLEAECPQSATPTLRLASYNIRHAADSSITELGNVLKRYAPSFVALQEVDFGTDRAGGRNQAYDLGQRVGLATTLRTTKDVDGGRQANALLFDYPMLANERVDLPQVDDEGRVLLIVTIELEPQFPITVGIVHLSIRTTDRAQQVPAVLDAMRGRPYPVLIGDFNERPDGDNIRLISDEYRDAWFLAGDGDGLTFPAETPDRRIDYVFLGEGWPDPSRAEVVESVASDHRPLIVEVPSPAPP